MVKENSSCIVDLGNNRYKCKNTGVTITTTVLPIRCGFCDVNLRLPLEYKSPPSGVTEYPSLLKQAVNFGKAIVNHAVEGFPRADEELIKQRVDVCNGCDRFDGGQGRCRECGCVLSVKISWRDQQCPLGKW